MPIYEYHCKSCGKTFELIEGFHEKMEKKCIHCEGKAKRLISQSSFVLKGTGWYLTDYARKSDKQGSTENKKTPQSSKDKKKDNSTTKDKKTVES
ncbi:MAG: FmdB family zinc ribbon protein [Thermodesulfobacteriota bacterium]